MRSKGELGSRAMFLAYEKSVEHPVDKLAYLAVLRDFNQRLLQLLLEGQSIKLPYSLGELSIEKKKVNFEKLKLDFGHWRKTGGEKIYHTNRHSDGYHAFFHWKKLTCNFTHQTLFKFSPARVSSRKLAALMKQEGQHERFVLATSKNAC